MTIDLDKLESLARAASHVSNPRAIRVCDYETRPYAGVNWIAFDPDVVLELIAELRAARVSDEDRRCLSWAVSELTPEEPAVASSTRKGAIEVIERLSRAPGTAESRVTELTEALRCAALDLDSAAVHLHDCVMANVASSLRTSASAASVLADSEEEP